MLRQGNPRFFDSLEHAFLDDVFSLPIPLPLSLTPHRTFASQAEAFGEVRPLLEPRGSIDKEAPEMSTGNIVTNRQRLMLVTCMEVVRSRSACRMRLSWGVKSVTREAENEGGVV